MKIRDKYWKLWDMAQRDPQYRGMLLRLRRLDGEYEAALRALSEDQREAVCDFVALCEAMSERMMRIACEQMEFQE